MCGVVLSVVLCCGLQTAGQQPRKGTVIWRGGGQTTGWQGSAFPAKPDITQERGGGSGQSSAAWATVAKTSRLHVCPKRASYSLPFKPCVTGWSSTIQNSVSRTVTANLLQQLLTALLSCHVKLWQHKGSITLKSICSLLKYFVWGLYLFTQFYCI